MYLIESLELITGIDALFVLSEFISSFKSFIEKSGLAASWIKTLPGLNFLIYLKAINEESDLSFPPLITETILGYFFLEI